MVRIMFVRRVPNLETWLGFSGLQRAGSRLWVGSDFEPDQTLSDWFSWPAVAGSRNFEWGGTEAVATEAICYWGQTQGVWGRKSPSGVHRQSPGKGLGVKSSRNWKLFEKYAHNLVSLTKNFKKLTVCTIL